MGHVLRSITDANAALSDITIVAQGGAMMALKPYSELVKIDVTAFCDTREALDDKRQKIQVPYLNWAKCKELLHENGAESVYYAPIKNERGGYLFASKEVQDKNGRTTGCYFVSIEIHIDDKTYMMDMPLMNGSIVVYDDTLNQLRIANCHARAFVKGVAIHTGLGFHLWSGDKDTDPAHDDLSSHSIMAIKSRIELLMTAKIKNGLDVNDLYAALGVKEKTFNSYMKSFEFIASLERALARL